MNVLVVAPHPDDEAIGCGGTIVRHAQRGDGVHVVFLSSGELSAKDRPAEEVRSLREHEARAAADVLGITRCQFLRRPDWGLGDDLEQTGAELSELVRELRPERIYVPHAGEWHPDHRAANAVTSSVLAGDGVPSEAMLTYEVWTPLAQYEVVEDISDQMERKLEAIRCYASQLETFDYLRAATGLNSYRGALAAHTAFAEVFAQGGGGSSQWPG